MVAAIAAMTALLAAGGCQKKDEAPKAAGLAPSAPGAVAPATAPAPVPPPPPVPADPAPGAATGATIAGKITVAPALKKDVSPGDVVYLTARRMPDTPGTRGSLVAVKRFMARDLPIPFSLSEADMMFKNGAFEGLLQLTVRVDKDGDPMSHKKGDLFGVLDNVKVGSAGVDVKVTDVQKEDENLAGGGPMQGSMPGMPAGHP
jgi:cytochrome c-type biogenesis protein CcmH